MPNIGPTFAAQLQYMTYPVWNGLIPKEGVKALLAAVDFSVNSSASIDLTSAQQQNFISSVQAVYIDNKNNTGPLSLSVVAGQMNVTIPPGWQGNVPLLVPNPPVFIATSTGSGTAKIYFINAPLPALLWPTTQTSPTFDSNGRMVVSDPALDACVTGNALNINGVFTPNATSQFTGVAVNFAAAGDNTIVAAVAAQRVKVYRMFFVCTGPTTITIKDGAGTSLTGPMALTANQGFALDADPNAWFTTTAGNAFIINSTAAIQVSGRCYYIQS